MFRGGCAHWSVCSWSVRSWSMHSMLTQPLGASESEQLCQRSLPAERKNEKMARRCTNL
ncbi:hypothetical protein IEO21_10977 [Rhodonia placenta]|uniref:Uncharacterized protein n=1 Tax=Rhodonia placenta TaxID=104341 RepID=A0A8H7NRK1_9APHY|nr:hypothetical protein IEO21_10977 [Postia placenta]